MLHRYFGRKRLEDQVENWVYDSEQLVHAGYSYWTLGYVLNLEGARKLIGKYIIHFYYYYYLCLFFI